MPMSNAKREANKKWNDANLKEKYDRIQLVIPKGEKDTIQKAAKQTGESVNGFIWRLIQAELDRMEREHGEPGRRSDTGAGVLVFPETSESRTEAVPSAPTRQV